MFQKGAFQYSRHFKFLMMNRKKLINVWMFRRFNRRELLDDGIDGDQRSDLPGKYYKIVRKPKPTNDLIFRASCLPSTRTNRSHLLQRSSLRLRLGVLRDRAKTTSSLRPTNEWRTKNALKWAELIFCLFFFW